MGELNKFFKDKKILITGHTGFKGSWLTKILVNWGASVVGVALPPHTSPNLFETLGLEKHINNYFADIRDAEAVAEIFKKERPEIVFHLAAQALVRRSYDEPLLTISTNAIGTANVLENIRNSGSVRAGVIITTDKVYKDLGAVSYNEDGMLGGHDPYSGSKAAADIIAQSYLKSFSLPVAIARAGNVIGGGDWSRDRLIPDLVRAIYEDKTKLVMRNPHHIRPWQHVFEPLRGYMLLVKAVYENSHPVARTAWNFGPNYEDALSVLDVVKITESIFGRVSYEMSTASDGKHETEILKLDSIKAIKELGWVSSCDAKRSVAMTMNWYRNFYENKEAIRQFTDSEIKNYFN